MFINKATKWIQEIKYQDREKNQNIKHKHMKQEAEQCTGQDQMKDRHLTTQVILREDQEPYQDLEKDQNLLPQDTGHRIKNPLPEEVIIPDQHIGQDQRKRSLDQDQSRGKIKGKHHMTRGIIGEDQDQNLDLEEDQEGLGPDLGPGPGPSPGQ